MNIVGGGGGVFKILLKSSPERQGHVSDIDIEASHVVWIHVG